MIFAPPRVRCCIPASTCTTTSGGRPAQAHLPALGDRRLGQLPVPLVWPGPAVTALPPPHVVGGAVAVLAFGPPGARRHAARSQRGQRPDPRVGQEPFHRHPRRPGGTGASAPGTARSAAPAVRPATSAGTRAPRTRRDGPAAAAARGARRSPPCSRPARVSRAKHRQHSRRSGCRARSPGSRRPGTACRPSSGCPAGRDSTRLTGSHPASGQERPVQHPARRSGRPVEHDPVQHAGELAAAARPASRRHAAAPVTGSPPPAREGWAPRRRRPAAGRVRVHVHLRRRHRGVTEQVSDHVDAAPGVGERCSRRRAAADAA